MTTIVHLAIQWRTFFAFVLAYTAIGLWAGFQIFAVLLLLNYVAVFWTNALRKA